MLFTFLDVRFYPNIANVSFIYHSSSKHLIHTRDVPYMFESWKHQPFHIPAYFTPTLYVFGMHVFEILLYDYFDHVIQFGCIKHKVIGHIFKVIYL